MNNPWIVGKHQNKGEKREDAMTVSDVIRVPTKTKEVCPVCLKENCEVRITRNRIPSVAEMKAEADVRIAYADIMGRRTR